MTEYPKTRGESSSLAVEAVGEEFVVYDLDRDAVHALNTTATVVWQLCDGTLTQDEIATRLAARYSWTREQAEAVTSATLDRFGAAQLMATIVEPANLSRRQLMRILGGAALLPTVYTLMAPTIAHAQSSCVSGFNSTCQPGGPPCCPPLNCVPQGNRFRCR